jgi:hypothetical protein
MALITQQLLPSPSQERPAERGHRGSLRRKSSKPAASIAVEAKPPADAAPPAAAKPPAEAGPPAAAAAANGGGDRELSV